MSADIDPARLAAIEDLATKLYTSGHPAERQTAERELMPFRERPEHIPTCQLILEHSKQSYALLLACNSLQNLVTKHWGSFSTTDRLDIRNYLLDYLAKNGPQLESFVSQAIMRLLARITKHGWFDDPAHREITQQVTKFLQATVEHCVIGLEILKTLIAEISNISPGRTLTFHRKVAVSFRDLALFHIFQIALTTLQQLLNRSVSVDSPQQESALNMHTLQLAKLCLTFDFIGTCPEESTEDTTSVQVPASWRQVIQDPATLQLLFDVHSRGEPAHQKVALESLVQMASIRRSLFADDIQRAQYLTHLMNGTTDIMQNQRGLQDQDNFHEFCRLLSRLKANNQLAEIIKAEGYATWIELLAKFTIASFNSWEWASNSIFYLLSLWSRLVMSLPYLKNDTSQLQKFVPEVLTCYITTRLESVRRTLSMESADDPLEDEARLTEQLETIPALCRFKYHEISLQLIPTIDGIFQQYQEAIEAADGNEEQFHTLEGQLAWLIHIAGAIVGGRSASSAGDQADMIDGELSWRVLRLMEVSDQRLGKQSDDLTWKERLDAAVLGFFSSFRRVYIGVDALTQTKVYQPLTEKLGLKNHLMVLQVVINKICRNLRCYTTCEEILRKSLELFQEIASSYTIGRTLLKLEIVEFVLMNHSHKHFPFVDIEANHSLRGLFYSTLTKLLFLHDNSEKFVTFMVPFDSLLRIFSCMTTIDEFRQRTVKMALSGLFRDLRGILSSANNHRTYALFFDWLYPNYIAMLYRTAELWFDEPAVILPMLKFLAELVYDKNRRLAFPPSSANGILLFKEVSKILCSYGNQIISKPVVGDMYNERYKSISQCFIILTRTMEGQYVNFGVFKLYNDTCFMDVLTVLLKFSQTIPLEELMVFPKLCKAFFQFARTLLMYHTGAFLEVGTDTFVHMLSCIQAGIRSLDPTISSQAAMALDHLAAFHFQNMGKDKVMQHHINSNPEAFPQLLKVVMEVLLTDDCQNQWCLSRPLLPLVIINEANFEELKQQIALSYTPDKQQPLKSALDKLMIDVTRSLEPKNRDKFTQNLSLFRHELKIISQT